MANTIRIKRRSTDSTAPTTSQAVNGELAFNESSEILYYGKGGNSSASSSVVKIGGAGAYLTTDTAQTVTGAKTFSAANLSVPYGNLKITGAGSNGQVLTANGTSGDVQWTTLASVSSYSSLSDGTTTASASGSDTIKFRATGPLTVTVGSNDLTHGDNVLYALGTVPIANGGTNVTSYTTGDILYYNSASSTTTLQKLGIGSSGQRLVVSGGVPSWSSLGSGEVTTALGYTPVNKAGDTLTGYLTLHADPSSSNHAATKNYVDTVAQGLHVHATADAATTAKLATLTGATVSYSSGTQAITWTGGTAANSAGFTDGTTLTASATEASASRILVKNEGDAGGLGAQYNGTYYVYGARELRRTSDGNVAADFAGGDFCYVVAGTLYEATGWVQTEKVVTLDTTSIIWQQFSGAGTITAGSGLTSTGTTINVGTADSSRIVVNPDSIDLATVAYSPDASSDNVNCVSAITVDSYGRVTASSTGNIRAGTTSVTGIVQLTNSTSSTSTTTAATPSSVKTAYDLANAALPKAGGTMTGKITTVTTSASTANILLAGAAADPSAPASGDLWNNSGTVKFYNGSATKTIAFTDSNITGTAAGLSSTLAVGSGGTGATTFTSNGILYGNSTSAVQASAAGTWDSTYSVGQLLSVNSSGVPTWTNTVDGGGY